MFVIAITRWATELAPELQPLAKVLGITAYDARLRLAGPLPVIFAHTPDRGVARSLVTGLRARGHGAVGCHLSRVPTMESMVAPRSFGLTPTGLELGGTDPPCDPVPWASVGALILAKISAEESTVTDTTKKSFSLGKAVMTGGLARSKTTKQRERTTTVEHEQVLFLLRNDGDPPVVFQATHVQYAGLGDRMQRTRAACFDVLLTVLQERAPHAPVDRSLFVGKRKTLPIAVVSARDTGRKRSVQSSTTAQSNAGPTAVAAHLIALAIGQDQR